MIIIDTNVISEMWRQTPDRGVLAWLDNQAIETLYLSVVTVAELKFGLAAMPEGKRREIFETRLESDVLRLFDGRILYFDLKAASCYADLMARARSNGRAIGIADGYIAATAVSHGFMVATRDTQPFAVTGVRTINPWA